MLYKLALWASLVFFGHGSQFQLALVLLLTVIRLVIHVRFEPNRDRSDNIFDYGILSVTTLFCLAGLLHNYMEVEAEEARLRGDQFKIETMRNNILIVDTVLLCKVILTVTIGALFLGRFVTKRARYSKRFVRLWNRCCCKKLEMTLLVAGPERYMPHGKARYESRRNNNESDGGRSSVTEQEMRHLPPAIVVPGGDGVAGQRNPLPMGGGGAGVTASVGSMTGIMGQQGRLPGTPEHRQVAAVDLSGGGRRSAGAMRPAAASVYYDNPLSARSRSSNEGKSAAAAALRKASGLRMTSVDM